MLILVTVILANLCDLCLWMLALLADVRSPLVSTYRSMDSHPVYRIHYANCPEPVRDARPRGCHVPLNIHPDATRALAEL